MYTVGIMVKVIFVSVTLLCVFAIRFVESHPFNEESDNSTIINQLNETKHTDNVPKTKSWVEKNIFLLPYVRLHRTSINDTCANNDEEDFPDFLSNEQVLQGGIILVIFIGVYGFLLLALVCNDYFLPCVETICEKLNLSPDVAAATFMSIATSTPELFTNIIATFITENDLGIGTIVGSSLYNALGVPAVGGLISPAPLQLDWYPLTRDSILYVTSIVVLIVISWDGNIYWYETLIPLTVYIIYFIIMFNNKRLSKLVKRIVLKKKGEPVKPKPEGLTMENDIPKVSILSAYGTYLEEAHRPSYEANHQKILEEILEEDKKEAKKSLFRRPVGKWYHKCFFYVTWPIKLILKCTIPNPKLHPNWFPVTFIMCIFWMGVNSYVISWMISIIGAITQLPDALLGMTLMAVGSDLPETVSMTIIARRGEGAFGVSNSLGANTMNILYSLGLPWLVKNLIRGLSATNPVVIQSGSIEYIIMSLILAVGTLYVILLLSKFRLSKISGAILGCTYVVLVVVAILSQTVFFKKVKC